MTSDPTFIADILVEIPMIQQAVDYLKNATEVLSDAEILHQKIPLVQSSVNDLIAGEGNSLAGMFDFTGMSNYALL